MTPTDFLLAPLRRVRRWILRPLDARITALTAENRALRASLEQVRAGLDEGLGTLGRTGIALRRHELAGEPAERSDATGRRQATEQDVSVSVVIVTYNRADALAEVLTLLRAQDHPAFEVVVVNGPSSDGTATILGDRAPDAKVVDCPEKNIAAARNLGLAAAGSGRSCAVRSPASAGRTGGGRGSRSSISTSSAIDSARRSESTTTTRPSGTPTPGPTGS